MAIIIAGGSGFVGEKLSKKLLESGYTVVIVDIMPPVFTHEKLFFINCDVTAGPLPYGILEKSDAVINLVGRNISSKWTEKVKKEIEKSRIESTQNIAESIKQATSKPSCFICASAIGFYGDTGEYTADEQTEHGEGFLVEVVAKWEAAARIAEEYGVRVVCIRSAPVLGDGGILSKITKTAKFGFLLKLKKEDFWMSWVHEIDIVNAYIFAVETTTAQGVFNACAPDTITHHRFMEVLSKTLHRRVIGHIPKIVIKKIFGDFFEEITKNQRAIPKRLIDKGFVFSHPTIEEALDQIFKK